VTAGTAGKFGAFVVGKHCIPKEGGLSWHIVTTSTHQ
jgi:hypothetical protein